MSLSEALLPEFDVEMASTRKHLERVPEDRMDWQPHEKSMNLSRLASHVAEIPIWVVNTLQQDSLDIEPPGGEAYQPTFHETRQALLDAFDEAAAAARRAISEAEDAAWGETWSLLRNGETLFSMPRIGVVRSMVLNHLIHHRAQLGVYLRMLDAPLPATYGPSADEGVF